MHLVALFFVYPVLAEEGISLKRPDGQVFATVLEPELYMPERLALEPSGSDEHRASWRGPDGIQVEINLQESKPGQFRVRLTLRGGRVETGAIRLILPIAAQSVSENPRLLSFVRAQEGLLPLEQSMPGDGLHGFYGPRALSGLRTDQELLLPAAAFSTPAGWIRLDLREIRGFGLTVDLTGRTELFRRFPALPAREQGWEESVEFLVGISPSIQISDLTDGLSPVASPKMPTRAVLFEVAKDSPPEKGALLIVEGETGSDAVEQLCEAGLLPVLAFDLDFPEMHRGVCPEGDPSRQLLQQFKTIRDQTKSAQASGILLRFTRSLPGAEAWIEEIPQATNPTSLQLLDLLAGQLNSIREAGILLLGQEPPRVREITDRFDGFVCGAAPGDTLAWKLVSGTRPVYSLPEAGIPHQEWIARTRFQGGIPVTDAQGVDCCAGARITGLRQDRELAFRTNDNTCAAISVYNPAAQVRIVQITPGYYPNLLVKEAHYEMSLWRTGHREPTLTRHGSGRQFSQQSIAVTLEPGEAGCLHFRRIESR